MHDLIFGLGFVAIVEGLVLALAPSRLKDLAAMLEQIPPARMRFLGLAVLGIGVFLLALAKFGLT
ncbi:MAG TPA: DUF2065 domain-containing protein [Paracoccaceae bacterium]|nr:DUF2065 domain-containing protein [Paracoccaceae bacterium]